MTEAEDIVRALAKTDLIGDDEYGQCPACRDRLYEHAASCPWRLAREWVEAYP